ncbi:MAG: ATP-binding protein [Bacteroidetes bacterium]|nr:ATP-binding protein [Bacteroidota bacterium]
MQLVPNWSKWVRRIYDQYNIRFFITGSNSKMTTVGIPTELRGRFIEKHIYPLNFREYLQFKKINIEVENIEYNQRVKSKLLKYVGDYLRIGGLPEIVLSQDEDFNELVQGYFRTVVSRDIIELHNIQNVNGLKALLKILLNSKEFTVNRIFNVLKSMNHEIGKTTLQNYIGYAHDAFFLNAVEAFSFKVVKAELHPRKVYFVDNAFIKNLSTKLSDDKARFFENSVAVLLQSKTEELNYFKTLNNQYEVDFVIRDHDKIKQLIQVCSDISNSKTMEREIRAFAQAQGELKCKNHLLINADTDKTEKVNWFGKKIEVRMIPLYRWLLEY